ncbi:aminoglycoside phosphotransferase family protein [Cellulomonas alba]|uniref:Aminoglycoside phosphotransferase family protein n=1 Tax=Cellulomonas alba TaxID=3053467 RepID=A0ABT7SE55_9CELL|nr:aminoglycoside phosphotransferase family protein [Cellulomonas alba]MDM7854451.1 aminoglycoside phosphotransferase family protein [Cellulomonas alba]
MHADELDLPTDLVARLVAEQLPRWAGLPVRRVASSGTDNAMFRLGDRMVVRLPRIHWAAGTVDHEVRWLPLVAGRLPVETPRVLATGNPSDDYPWSWSVLTWLDGVNPRIDALDDPDALARELVTLVRAIRALELPDGEPKDQPLSGRDDQVRRDLAALADDVDIATLAAIWDEALAHAEWDGTRTWVHHDLAPGNLLLRDGRLSGLIDFAGIGLGDAASDLGVAWNLLPAGARATLRDGLGVDDATWVRGRARALAQALVQLPYYRDTNPVLAANAWRVLREVLADARHA